MYSSPDGRTMIKIGGSDNSKVEPRYSVPIQTPMTLNVQLRGPRVSATSVPAHRPQQMTRVTPLSTSSAAAAGAGGVSVGASGGAVRATRVSIVAEVPPSKGTSMMTSSDDAMSSLGTQTDFGFGPHASSNSQLGGYSASAAGRDEMLLSASSQTAVFGANPASQTRFGSSVLGTEFSDAGSQYSFSNTGTQVGSSDTGSLLGSSSGTYGQSSGTHGQSSGTYGQSSGTHGQSIGMYDQSSGIYDQLSGIHGQSSGIYGQSSGTHDDQSSGIYAQISRTRGQSSANNGGSSGTNGQSPATSGASSVISGSRDADDDEGSEYRVFTDANGGKLEVADETAAKLAQGIQGLSTTDGGDVTGDGPSGEDDSDSEGGWEELGKPADPSTFNVIEWDLPNEKSSKQPACSRVIIMKDKEMILMLKATCSLPKTGNDSRLWSLMVEISDNCSKRLKKMKTLPVLRAQHMDTLPLSDGKTTKEHLAKMSQVLGDNIGIKEVAYRFQPAGDVYIGTYVKGTVLAKRNYAIGRIGVVAVLFKKSKYATVEAFSEQLCEHIAIAQPTTLGHLSETDLKKLNRRGTMRIKHLQKDQLLVQNFVFDPTIVVAEAARRSFVRLDDFLLFK